MNIENIVNAVIQCLDDHDKKYDCAEVRDLVDRWAGAKSGLIDILRNHPNWDEDAMAVVFDYDSQRDTNCALYSDALNKLREMYFNTDITEAERDRFYEATNPYTMCYQFVNERIRKILAANDVKSAIGAKVSRVLGKYFREIGLDKIDGYNTHYAALSDALNPLKVTRYTLLSVHPCDYLNMSNGTGWQSCHNIDDGGYMAGTLSYMGDECTMILYTVDRSYSGESRMFWREKKINRQVYAYHDNALLQSRLYPNCSDSDNCNNFRNAVQKIMAEALGIPNMWKLLSGWDDKLQKYIETYSSSKHYPDYEYDSYDAKLSLAKGLTQEGKMVIGSRAYCLSCGDTLNYSDSLNCCVGLHYCAECGEELDDDCAIQINGEYYCEDCVVRCDRCGDYFVDSEGLTGTYDYDYVCDDCLSRCYTECACCNEYYPNSHLYSTGDDNAVCPNCIQDNYLYCNECDTYYPNDPDYMTNCDDGCICVECLKEKGEHKDEVA